MKLSYNNYSSFIKSIFGEKVQKISIDAGFTCPNRDGSKGVGGCSFCNNKSFSPTSSYNRVSVKQQIDRGISKFYLKYPDMKYLAYFQSYTNTYGDFEHLCSVYQEALNHPKIMGIVIGTRPDCVNDELLDYLKFINKSKYVAVEYGVESCNNNTLQHINRGHTFESSVKAILDTQRRGIHTGAHMILGLPLEDKNIILNNAKEIAKLPLTYIKLHQLQIVKNTLMEKEFINSPENFSLFHSVDEYVDLVVDFVELLNPNFIIERFSSSSPKEILISPNWEIKNYEISHKVNMKLISRNTWQGKLFKT